ncbi:uncharacterized protein LOC125959354 [Anopheles darlingi]|uniref:uncharacterized protein LOC125959354 n=1 Tax=Anopheles darlingi TaxID=43151 RepID=UPI0021005870|nr:uncharacterized protein LOC125959354 [Anopheles darlingi]
MQTPEEVPNLATFSQWLYATAETFSRLSWAQRQGPLPETRTESRAAHQAPGTALQSSTPSPSASMCAGCGGECRAVERCSRFISMDTTKRWEVAREGHLCFVCLRRHKGACGARPCGSEGCTGKHHALLHRGPSTTINTVHEPSEAGAKPGAVHCIQIDKHCEASDACPQFRYHSVILHGRTSTIKAMAFVDEGSSFTLVEEDLADELGLDGPNQPLHLQWTGGITRVEKRSRVVTLKISGTPQGRQYTLSGVKTVQKLDLPAQTLDSEVLQSKYRHLRGVRLEPYTNERPKLLIGIGHLQVGLVLKCREGAANDPVAVKSRLGWTVCGGADKVHNVAAVQVRSSDSSTTDEEIHQALNTYFSLDSLGVTKATRVTTTEDARCLELLTARTRLVGDRYETGLLWREDDGTLPNSRPMALQRFQQLQRRMKRSPEFARTLKEKIKEYEEKRYIRKLSVSEEQQDEPRRWYLPIFVVTNPNKPGKVRLVWDAAAEVRGTSLNSALLTGPDLLSSLFEILIRFREGRIGVTGDIREMFHQVRIRPEDQSSQCFLWENEHGEVETYAMQVMTFGARCSPSTAQYVKNINAQRFAETHPNAVKAIIHAHYVDDMLVSVDREEEAIQLALDVAHVHREGGFEIRGWISNSPQVLSALHGEPEEKHIECTHTVHTEKVLGMWWDTAADTFTYRIGRNKHSCDLWQGTRCPTKREVLSVLMAMFDPLGLLANFLAYLKILLQKIWRSGVQWDEPIDSDSFTSWKTWLKALPEVEKVRIPRWYGTSALTRKDEIELHTFVDASENGAAAACYIRHATGGAVHCCLVAAKTRVAPLRFTSIPRMELEAAVLGARLCRSVEVALRLVEEESEDGGSKAESSSRFFWTDSRNVLGWLNSDSRRYSQHVGHRVVEILKTSKCREWRWVPTKLNPADDATKWSRMPDLAATSRWFRGPQFLWESVKTWPAQPAEKPVTGSELRPAFAGHHSPDAPSIQQPVVDVTRFSDWAKVLVVTGRVLRFVHNCRASSTQRVGSSGPITAEERSKAQRVIINQAQREAFPAEIDLLKNAKTSTRLTTVIPKQSPIHSLSPYLDECGILRMRTRIAACHYATEDAKRPVILPRRHPVTELIVRKFHERFHHRNHETVINEVRQLYHIPHLRSCYARVRRNCQWCKNAAAEPKAPIMADLPPARLAAYVRPFTYVGLDYFGPIEVAVGRRVEKRWGMLATCLTVRAVHIELVHSLTTSSCIMGLRNLIARRGTPLTIFCDRGTNFVGAQRELQRNPELIDHVDITKECSQRGIRWEFNPPQASHMGGSWERLIRTVKENIVAASSAKRLNDEVLRSLLVEVESIMNARPLTHVPVDDDSAPALTPNHFLLGSSNGMKQPGELDDSGSLLRQNWRTSQALANRFWRRWVTDYLPEITRRTKWHRYNEPIRTGDVVVIVDPRLPRNSWPKGVVEQVFASKQDGQVRSARVRTANSTYVRPVTKLAVLDVIRQESGEGVIRDAPGC